MDFKRFKNEHLFEHSDLVQKIHALQHKRQLRLFKKMETDNDPINLLSWMSEMRIGLFFDLIADDLRYEQKWIDKTPDWTVIMNGQTILAEALRINPSHDRMMEEVATMDYVRQWRKKNPGIPLISASKASVSSSEFLYGAQSKLGQKEQSYTSIVAELQIPLIICVTTTVARMIDHDDFFDFLIGHNNRGYFFANPDFGQTVTGILLKTYWNQFVYFPNPNAKFALCEPNSLLLSQYHYLPR